MRLSAATCSNPMNSQTPKSSPYQRPVEPRGTGSEALPFSFNPQRILYSVGCLDGKVVVIEPHVEEDVPTVSMATAV